jgi:hypothetical protein
MIYIAQYHIHILFNAIVTVRHYRYTNLAKLQACLKKVSRMRPFQASEKFYLFYLKMSQGTY